MKLNILFILGLSIPFCLSYSRRRGSQQMSFHTKSAKLSGEKNDKDMKFLKKLDTINDVPQHPRKKILPQSKNAKETVIIRDGGIPVGMAEEAQYQRDDGGSNQIHDEEKEIAQAINPKGRVQQALLLARSSKIHKNQDTGDDYDYQDYYSDQSQEDGMYSDETPPTDQLEDEHHEEKDYEPETGKEKEEEETTLEAEELHDSEEEYVEFEEESTGVSAAANKAVAGAESGAEPDVDHLTDAQLIKVSEEVPEPRLEPLEDWNYLKIRDLLSQLNNALYAYSNKLTKDILKGKVFQTKSIDCTTKYSTLFSECKSIIQDKISLQQELDDLRNKYTSLEQVLAKIKDINEDNRQTIDKLRAKRDQCVREDAEKVKTINSLRSRAAELRRRLARFRGSIKQ